MKGLTRKHSVIHSSIHHISEQLCDCKFKYFLSYLNLVQLYTCILAILHTCLSGCRSGWSSPKSGWGLSRVRVRGWVRGKKLPQQLPPLLLGSHLTKLHHRPKDQTKQGSLWVRLGQPGSGPGLNIQKRLQQDLRLTEDSEPRNHNLFQTAKCTMLIDMILYIKI